jgi:polyhydroxyalkanoate synthase subunit PhaC
VIVQSGIVEQVIDRHVTGSFYKDLVVTGGAVPLSMVRKRSVQWGQTRAPVLLVHGFGQNRYSWHLPARSFANHLARAGFDVFNLDLRGHGRSRREGTPQCRGVEDYAKEDLPAAIEEVHALSGQRPVWIVGHSLGGLVSFAAAPALGGAIGGIASIGSPYDFARGSLSLGVLKFVMRLVGRVPMPNAPMPLAPVGLALRTLRGFAESPLYPLPIRGWHKGSCEPHVLEQYLSLAFDRVAIQVMFDMFQLETRFRRRDSAHFVRFEAMDLPLLFVAGENDDLAPPLSVRGGFTKSQSRDKTYTAFPLGHIDLLVGRDAPTMTWSEVTAWLEKRAARAV